MKKEAVLHFVTIVFLIRYMEMDVVMLIVKHMQEIGYLIIVRRKNYWRLYYDKD